MSSSTTLGIIGICDWQVCAYTVDSPPGAGITAAGLSCQGIGVCLGVGSFVVHVPLDTLKCVGLVVGSLYSILFFCNYSADRYVYSYTLNDTQ